MRNSVFTLAAQALQDPAPAVRAEAAEALGDLITRALAVRTELSRLSDADPKVQETAIRSLMARDTFVSILQSAPAPVRQAAVATLQRMAADLQEKDKAKDAEKLLARVSDISAAPAAGTQSIANVALQSAINPLLNALADGNGSVASTASLALSRAGEYAVPSLIARLGGGDTIAYRASQALELIGRPAVDSLVAAAQPGKGTARWAAITLGEIGDPRARPALQTLSTSGDPDTRWAAGIALTKVAES